MSKESQHAVRAVFLAAIMVISVFAAGIAFSGSAAADGHIITVDQSGDGDYTSIDSALSNADPDDRIEIENGTYSNSAGITIGTEGVTLTAADGADPTIEVAPSSVSGTAAVDIQATGVTVSNLTIERIAADGRASDAGHAQGIIVSRSGATIKDNDVVGDLSGSDSDTFDRFDGITVIDPNDGSTTDNIDISDNDISGFDTGVVVTTFYGGDVADVTVSNTDTTNNRIGFVAKTHDGSISGISGSNNDFTGNDGESIVFSPDSYQNYESLNSIPTTAVSFDGPISVEDGDSVQTAINVAADGATISVGPGTYNESAAIPDDPGDNEVGLYVGTPDLTIQGVDSSGNPITDRENVQAHIISEEGTSWGTNGVYVDAPGTTFTGLEFSPDPDSDPNKNFEVVDDDFTLRHAIVNDGASDDVSGSVYFNTPEVQSFELTENEFEGVVSVNNGAGNATDRSERVIEDNTFHSRFQITGVDDQVDWYNKNSGAVTLTGNNFTGSSPTPVFTNFENEVQDQPWEEYFTQNTFVNGASITFEDGEQWNVRRSGDYKTIYTEIGDNLEYVAQPGDTVSVQSGTYNESVKVNKPDITIRGEESPVIDGRIDILADGTTIEDLTVRDGDPSGPGEVEAIFIGNTTPSGFDDTNEDVVIRNVTVEDVHPHDSDTTVEGIHVKHYDAGENIDGVVISDVTIQNVTQPAAGANGVKLQAGIRNVSINDSTVIEDIEGSWAYGVVTTPSSGESGVPENVDIERNTITNITATTYDGVGVGIDGSDDNGFANPEEVTVSRNNLENNDIAVLNKNDSGLVDAGENWWGSEDGPNAEPGNDAQGQVATAPFLTVPYQQLESTDDGSPRQFATELELTGGVNTIAFPAPSERTLNESLNTSNVDNVLVYDNSEGSWTTAGNPTPDALDVYVVIVDEGETASLVMEFDNDFDADDTQLSTAEVSGGWNLVSPSQAADTADGAYATRNAEIGLTSENPFQSPHRQPFDADNAEFSPYRGYWTFVDEDDGPSTVGSSNFEGLTLLDYLENVNLPPEDE